MTLTIELSAAQCPLAGPQQPAAPAPPHPEDPTLALFRQWEQEGTARTAEEAAQENELWEQFQANLNETRHALGMRRL